MSCTRPKKAIKKPYGNTYMVLSRLDAEKYSQKFNPETGELFEILEIPCGRCPSCRKAQAQEWSTRLEMESTLYPEDHNYFVTLTYDDEHLPVAENGSYTLNKRDVSDWLKRFRKRMAYHGLQSEGIRFFAAGEYGEKSYRPHYHVLLFNCNLKSNLKLFKVDNGNLYYTSEFVTDTWSKGHCLVCPMTSADIKYTARYTLKKAGGRDNGFYELLGVAPEFTLMSRRPGIGYGYDISNALDNGLILPNGNFATIPKYNLKKSLNTQKVSKYKVLSAWKGQLRSGNEEKSDEELENIERKQSADLRKKKNARKEL